MLAPHGKAVEPVEVVLVEIYPSAGYRCAGDEGASLPPADGSAVASLPRAQDKKLMEVKVPLVQVETRLRSMQVKRQANRRHSLVAL